MRKTALTIAAVAATIAAVPAMAAEAGPYVGVGVTLDNYGTTGGNEGLGMSGVGGTVYGGYNMPLTPKVWAGVEANFDIASADADYGGYKVKADHSYGIAGRLGYNVSDSTAVYGKVGYQRGRLTDTDGIDKSRSNRDGLRLGGGVETALTEKVGLRLEYNHTHYYADKDAVNQSGIQNNQATVGVNYKF